MVALFHLTAIASIGSAVVLMIFFLITSGHLRVRHETGARSSILVLALATTGVTFLTFVFTTLLAERASIATLILILGVSIALDIAWSRARERPTPAG
jgi:L-asparagine transporter-like permease